MRILFIHQNYPGQFGQLAAALAGRAGLDVYGLGNESNIALKPQQSYPVFAYRPRKPAKSSAHHYLHSFEAAIRRGQDVVLALQTLRQKNIVPDLVIGHPAWGELLFVKDVFPAAKVITYCEYFYRAEGGDVGFDPEFPANNDDRFRVRIKNSTQLHALEQADAGISPTEWQRSSYPQREQQRIEVIHEGLNLQRLGENADASFTLADGRVLTRADQVITFVSRKLEPYRGFHVFMRALPELQKRLPRAHFCIAGADGVSYGMPPPAPHEHYRGMLMQEVGSKLDMSRTHFTGALPYDRYLALMQISRLHIYLSYPFVLSWSMLEAMACGAPVLGSATPPVEEILKEGYNGHLFDFFNQAALVEKAAAILGASPTTVAALTQQARRDMASSFSFEQHSLPKYLALIERVMR